MEQRRRQADFDVWDRTWKDRDGNVTIWQFPNYWLIGWLVLTIASLMIRGLVSDILMWTASASLIIWSLLEIFKGVNYFRRIFGLAVLAAAIAILLNNI